jgi:Flp pilus assembly pilin Flp
MNAWVRLTRRQDGQDLLEYGLLASLIALFCLGAVTLLGQHLNTVFWSVIGPSI